MSTTNRKTDEAASRFAFRNTVGTMDKMETVEVTAPAYMTPEERKAEADFLKSQSPEGLRQLFSEVCRSPAPKVCCMHDSVCARMSTCWCYNSSLCNCN